VDGIRHGTGAIVVTLTGDRIDDDLLPGTVLPSTAHAYPMRVRVLASRD